MTDEELIATARATYCSDDLEIDDAPVLSRGDDGAWVQAWVWVPYPDTEDDESDDESEEG